MIVITLALTALLCLAFTSTRLFGVVLLAFLFCIYTVAFTLLILLACVAIFYFRKFNNRRKLNAYSFPKFPLP